MTTAWLVIIKDDPNYPLSYADMNRVYAEDKMVEAIQWAKFNGYEDPMGLGINKEIGIANVYSCKRTITIMHIIIRGD